MTIEHDGLADLGWDGHLMLLHRSETERRSRLARWVRRGLERDEQVLYGHDEDGRDDSPAPQRSVLAVLSEHGIDAEAATSAGQLRVLPSEALYGPGPG